MVGEMVQNSQSLYSFTFTAVIVIHEYIYSHSTTKFTFKKYICLHLTTYFLFTNIFTHIYGMYSFTFNRLYPFTFTIQRCNIHSTFSAHSLCASLGPSSRSFLNADGRRRKAQWSGRPKTTNTSVTLVRSFFCSSRSLTRVRTGMEHCGSRSEREHPNKARVSHSSSPASFAFPQYQQRGTE